MKTWNDYKDHVKAVDPERAKDLEEGEKISAIVSATAAAGDTPIISRAASGRAEKPRETSPELHKKGGPLPLHFCKR